MFLARIRVTLKPTVNDPQGKTIANALERLSFGSVQSVRAGKYFEVEVDSSVESEAHEQVASMCEKLLSNPVIETFEFDLESVG